MSNLLNAVFKKYHGQNGVRGNAVIEVQSAEEARRLQDYFGNRLDRRIKSGSEIKLPLKYFAEELEQGYKLTIPSLYEILYDAQLLTRAEQRELKEAAWMGLFKKVSESLKKDERFKFEMDVLEENTFQWFQRLKEGNASGYRVLKSALNKNEKAEKALFDCMVALWYLLIDKKGMYDKLDVLSPKIPIPMFALFVTLHPHGFDWTETAGRLLWYALYDIDQQRIRNGQRSTSKSLTVAEYMHRRQIYRNFELHDDDISSFSHVFAPGFTTASSPRTLNLREIEEIDSFPFYKSIYIIENPSLLSYLVDEIVYYIDIHGFSLEQLPQSFPVLLCTSGRARNAAQMFLDKCVAANPKCRIYYSGDMDLQGVQMMKDMKEQFSVGINAWRMNAETYLAKYGYGQHIPLSLHDIKILEKELDDLSKVMAELGVKVYQEEIAGDLKKDVLEEIDRELHNLI